MKPEACDPPHRHWTDGQVAFDQQEATMNEAFKHMRICQELLEREPISAAQAYCAGQGIVPPAIRNYGTTEVAERLGDYGWWAKRLKLRNARARHLGSAPAPRSAADSGMVTCARLQRSAKPDPAPPFPHD